jgi:hypothetical protein
MTKRYCAGCGKEITDLPTGRLTGRIGRIAVEVMVAVDNTWNSGQACEDCIRAVCAISKMTRISSLYPMSAQQAHVAEADSDVPVGAGQNSD